MEISIIVEANKWLVLENEGVIKSCCERGVLFTEVELELTDSYQLGSVVILHRHSRVQHRI